MQSMKRPGASAGRGERTSLKVALVQRQTAWLVAQPVNHCTSAPVRL